ncbi:serine/threonine protein phosphatase PrpC [Arthrobacter pigmenti]|uniref:Serine/threonine protein phosphatase PrpC n=1 Tax=Arthrobacter pigmenti TaxID=271432 RepID=A0A846RKW7_9MICC|nr:protein phosphatase 2C domain-containing protein [Arthrobacter pigmenti]NJC24008.1 serine/threonine protein phosphatase PrpC [Arthrobacter pigmenti]
MTLAFQAAGRSWQGAHRDNNEDSFLTSESAIAVADGVGGHAGGEVASAMVIQNLAAVIQSMRGRELSENQVRETIATANFGVSLRVRHDEALTGMSTTLSALFRGDGGLLLAHIGDSRAYLLRGTQVHQVSRDDSYIQDLLDAQKITAADSRRHPMRSVVLKVLSGDNSSPTSSVGLSRHEALDGDRWLLCSDGLTDYVPIELVEETLSAGLDPEATADILIALAGQHDSRDNITLVVCDVVNRTTTTAAVQVGGAALELYGALPAPGMR